MSILFTPDIKIREKHHPHSEVIKPRLITISISEMSYLQQISMCKNTTGWPKKNGDSERFWVCDLGRVFLGVKNNSENFGNKKILGCLAKFRVNGPCFVQNLPFFLSFYNFVSFKNVKIIWKVKIFNIYMCICKNIDFYDILKKFSILDMFIGS